MPGLEAVGIIVSDIAESCRFYRLLGIEAGEPPAAEDHFETTLSNGLRLMWDSETLMRQIDGSWTEPVGQRIGLAFGCAGPAEVDLFAPL
jgi:catechol 2,3-dioxygenase-like lactoylglutathione lyase family enzyme